MGGLEVGDRRVVVLLAEFLDRALVAVTSSLAGLDAFGVELREAGGHVEADAVARRGRGHRTVGRFTEEPDIAGCERRLGDASLIGCEVAAMRRDHDVVELEVRRAAVVEVGHREAVDVVDLIGHRAVQHRDAPLAFHAAQRIVGGGGEEIRVHPTGGEDDIAAGRIDRGGEFDGVIGVTDHENISAFGMLRFGVDRDRREVGERDRRGPIRHRGPVSEEDRSRPVAVPVCREQQGAVVGGVDGLDVFAVADVELVVAHEFGERHGVAAGDQPDRLHARTLGGDGNAESASGAADDHKVVDEVKVLLGHVEECARRGRATPKGGPATMLDCSGFRNPASTTRRRRATR